MIQARELMSPNPTCCSPETSIGEAARLMREHDCGCLPVQDGEGTGRVVGVVTDRDIATRAVAEGRTHETAVGEVMSADPSCCRPEDSAKDVERIMAERQVRRVPVVDEAGCCIGMVAQADLARSNVSAQDLARTVEKISEPSGGKPRRESQVGVQPRTWH